MGFINQLYYTKLNNVHDRSGVGAIGQAVRGERGFMTKQLNVVDHKIKLFKAPLPPPRRRKRSELGEVSSPRASRPSKGMRTKRSPLQNQV